MTEPAPRIDFANLPAPAQRGPQPVTEKLTHAAISSGYGIFDLGLEAE